MANTVINTPELLNLDSTTGATILAKGTISERPTTNAIDGALRFNTDTNKTEYYDGTGWYEIVDEYASGFIGPATNYFDTKLYTGNGSSQSIGGYINGGASFNGSSSIISIPNLKSVLDNNFSVSFWWKPELMNTFQVPVGGLYNEAGGAAYGWMIYQGSDNKMYLYWIISISPNTSNAFSNNTVLTQGSWYHIVATKSSTGAALYVNKADAASSPSAGSVWNIEYNTNPDFYFGKRNISNNYANGELDQVRLYDTILTQANVDDLYDETATTAATAAFPSGQTAVATYTMDTSANGLLTTTDLSTVNYPAGAGCLALYEMNGNSNDTSGTYNGTPTDITYEGGAFAQAAVFNGSSSRIQIASTSTDPVNISTGTFSVSMWVNMDNLTNNNKLVYKWGTTAANRNFLFTVLSSSGYLYFIEGTTGGDVLRVGTFALSINTWHHIALTREQGGSLKMYVDGDLKDTFSATGIFKTSSEPIYLGYQVGQTTNFTGKIDQVRIFNTALTQSQVTTLARGIATSYSGAATNVNFNGHLDFAPDFVWIKSRTFNDNHNIADTVRGATKYIFPNLDSYEFTSSAYLNRFNANGFSIGSDNSGNKIGENFVSWNWKGGGTAVTNNNGTIASQVSANKDSGFSIVKYTGNNTDGATVGTGLTEACNIVIVKDLTSANYWCVGGSTVGNGENLYLNDTGQKQTRDRVKSVQTNTFTLGSHFEVNSSNNFIAYCFHSVTGYSKMETYTGNGTGKTIYLDSNGNGTGTGGFQPSFVMIKRTDSTGNWWIFDNARGNNKGIRANLSGSEDTTDANANTYEYRINFLSDGFQYEVDDNTSANPDLNALNGTYIYMAFA